MQCLLTVILLALRWRPRLRQLLVNLLTVGKTWVHARCRENAQAIAAMRRGMKGKPPRIVPAKLEWGTDLTLARTSDGSQNPTLTVIDHGSRALLRIKVLSRKSTWTLLSEFCAACAEHGVPDAVRTDNEAMFTGRLWVSFFKIAGIKRQRIDPGCPWQNGRIERLFGTLKPLLRQLFIPDAAGAAQRVRPFLQPCTNTPEPGWPYARRSLERAGPEHREAPVWARAMGAGAGWADAGVLAAMLILSRKPKQPPRR